MAESLSLNNVTRQIAHEDILNNQRWESFKSYKTLGIGVQKTPDCFINNLFTAKELRSGIACFGVIEPYFFEDENGEAASVTSERYIEMIRGFLVPELGEEQLILIP